MAPRRRAQRKPEFSPGPWLIFFASILGGPAIAIITGLLTANVQSARFEERLTTTMNRQADLETRLASRGRDNDARSDRIEQALRQSETATTQATTRIEGLQRDIEAAERRTGERLAGVVEAIRRLQDRVGTRPMEFPAVFRRDITEPEYIQ